MNSERPRFPEYGEGGDYIGARRGRRAFRSLVAGALLFSMFLAFAERYLQYGDAERLYLIALTLPPESSRVFLRQAVRKDEQAHETPTPKYVQALAPREEDEKTVLDTYAKAFKLERNNAGVAMRYGCKLLAAGRAREAVEKFDVAASVEPQNALPMYLKAAAELWNAEGREQISESLALVAQANNSGKQVVFPRPLWFSELPQQGVVYAELCRDIVDECSAPLYHYSNVILRRAQDDAEKGRASYWDSWLLTVQEMGERVTESAVRAAQDADSSPAGLSLQAIVGVRIQLATLEQRERISAAGKPRDELAALHSRLNAALDKLQAFENSRDDTIADDRHGYRLPARLCLLAVFGSWVLYLFSYVAWRQVRKRSVLSPRREPGEEPDIAVRRMIADASEEPERTLRHSRVYLAVLTAGAFLLFLTLVVVMVLQRNDMPSRNWIPAVSFVWWTELLVLAVAGVAYPLVRLSRPSNVLRKLGPEEEDEEVRRHVRRLHRRASLSLMSRYYGILAGSLIVVLSMWSVGYRMSTGLYPWQTQLLTTGLIAEEGEVVREAVGPLT